MSDFDKEAEREKLREQYERDRRKRKATQRMSDLLLRGATMTNRHCDECKDPLFRYEGQVFCATCERTVEPAAGPDDEAEEEGERDGAGTDEAAESRAGGPEVDAATGDGSAAAVDVSDDASAGAATGADGDVADGTDGDSVASTRPSGTATTPARDVAPAATAGTGAPAGTSSADGSRADAIAALLDTVTSLARRAERAEDPRRAADYLEAAAVAAETLDRLERR